jgi:hypothetical protein
MPHFPIRQKVHGQDAILVSPSQHSFTLIQTPIHRMYHSGLVAGS